MPRTAKETRAIALIGFPGVQSLDVAGPMEVFTKADTHRREYDPPYEIHLASPKGGTIVTNSGLQFAGTVAIEELPRRLDTIVIAGGDEPGLRQAAADAGFMAWLRKRARATRRVASVCTGAFLLANAGLLHGRRATTHWNACAVLQSMWPDIRLDEDAIFVADPPFYTSAGITAGIDLCLAFIEEDCGRAAALRVARELVVFMHRPGGQSQFSNALRTQVAATSPLSQMLSEIAEDPRGDLRVPALAARARMTERTFVRAFRKETGTTPARFVQEIRVERARTLLETTPWPLARIAERSGFGSVHSLHRAFLHAVDTTPAEYRARFGSRL